MSKFKRTNRGNTATQKAIVVGTGNQNLAAGALVNGTTSLAIADNQLGVLSWDFDGTVALGTFITAGVTAANVRAIKVLQGTNTSASIHTADIWGVSEPGYVESGIIHRDLIRSVTTLVYRVPSYSAYAVTDIPTVTAATEYGAYVYLYGVRNDREYSDNDEVVYETVETPDSLSSITDPTDWVISGMLYKFNSRSRLAYVSNSAAIQRGNKNYIALGINTAGSFGQALGTITCAGTPTTIPVMKSYDVDGNAATTNLITNVELVKALAKVIDNQADAVTAGATITDQITTSSTIEIIDPKEAGKGVQARATVTMTNVANLAGDTITVNGTALVEGVDWARGASTTTAATAFAAAVNSGVTGITATSSGAVVTLKAVAYGVAGNAYTLAYVDGGSAGATISGATFAGGAASNIDAFIFIGLDQPKSVYFDDIMQVQNQVEVNVAAGFTSGATTKTKVVYDEGTNQGWKWTIEDNDRARMTRHTAQNVPFGEYFSRGFTFVDPTVNYTATLIDYYDYEETLTTREQTPKQLAILLAATATCTTVTQAVTNLATTDAIVTATTDAGTVASLEAILGAWLDSAVTYSGHVLKGVSATGANFA